MQVYFLTDDMLVITDGVERVIFTIEEGMEVAIAVDQLVQDYQMRKEGRYNG